MISKNIASNTGRKETLPQLFSQVHRSHEEINPKANPSQDPPPSSRLFFPSINKDKAQNTASPAFFSDESKKQSPSTSPQISPIIKDTHTHQKPKLPHLIKKASQLNQQILEKLSHLFKTNQELALRHAISATQKNINCESFFYEASLFYLNQNNHRTALELCGYLNSDHHQEITGKITKLSSMNTYY